MLPVKLTSSSRVLVQYVTLIIKVGNGKWKLTPNIYKYIMLFLSFLELPPAGIAQGGRASASGLGDDGSSLGRELFLTRFSLINRG